MPEIGPWPVELFVERRGIAACATLTLTSLFSLPLLFGIPSFSMAARYVSMLPYPNDVMAQLVMASIRQLDETEPTAQDWRGSNATTADPLEQPSQSDFNLTNVT